MNDIRKILALLAPYKLRLLAVAVCNVLSAIFAVFSIAMLAPFLSLIFGKIDTLTQRPDFGFSSEAMVEQMKYVLSRLIVEHGSLRALFVLTAVIFLCFLFTKTFSYAAVWLMAKVRTSIVQTYREQTYNHLLILPLSFYSQTKKGDVLSRVVNDVQDIDFSILQSIQQLLGAPVLICFYLFALAFINWQLTMFVLCVFPIAGLIISRLQRRLKRVSADLKHTQGLLLSLLEESLYGLRIIQAFVIERKAALVFGRFNQSWNRLYIKMTRRKDLSSPMGELLGTVTVVIILLFGSYMVFNEGNAFPAELFVTYIAMFSQIINPAKATAESTANVRKGLAAVERVETFLAQEEKITEKPMATLLDGFQQSIEFRNVCFSYEETNVLENINLTIDKGKTIAFCGVSGAGKSTLTDLMMRFYDVTKGNILFDGKDVRTLNINSVRGLFGLVSQESILFHDTIYNNIVMGMPTATFAQVEQAARLANAYDFIMNLENGFNTTIGERGVRLSGGQKQRISIARALLRQTPILIFDEATSAMDAALETSIQTDLETVCKNLTTIIVAHRLSTIINAHEIIVLDKGRIVERGTHQQLLNQNRHYKQMIDRQTL